MVMWQKSIISSSAKLNGDPQNPSLTVLEKIAKALGIDLYELFSFEHEIQNRKDIEARMMKILKIMSEDDLKKFHLIFNTLYPIH